VQICIESVAYLAPLSAYFHREKTTSISGGVPAVVSAQAWDGKDATIAVDEVPMDFMDE
jgi:hypothetical protein